MATSQNPVIFTSLADDDAGGDTNLDGDATVPLPGDWDGIRIVGSGQFIRSEFVYLRYLQMFHS